MRTASRIQSGASTFGGGLGLGSFRAGRPLSVFLRRRCAGIMRRQVWRPFASGVGVWETGVGILRRHDWFPFAQGRIAMQKWATDPVSWPGGTHIFWGGSILSFGIRI